MFNFLRNILSLFQSGCIFHIATMHECSISDPHLHQHVVVSLYVILIGACISHWI